MKGDSLITSIDHYMSVPSMFEDDAHDDDADDDDADEE